MAVVGGRVSQTSAWSLALDESSLLWGTADAEIVAPSSENPELSKLLSFFFFFFFFFFFLLLLGSGDSSKEVERQTPDRKVSGSSPGRSDGRKKFCGVNFLC